jgi:4-methylaminobutanoate oxidase (formaldehyde-forming)
MGRIVIIGGGAVGLSLAWHLARRGADDVMLLERNQLTSGTSWHAAGIVGPLRATPNMTQLAMYAEPCFQALEKATGMSTGYKRTGGYWLAREPARMDELQRTAALGNHFGLHTSVLTADGLQERLPWLDLQQHVGGIAVAEDGNVNPVDLCMAYAKAARDAGVTIREHTAVDEICVQNAGVMGVKLNEGSVIEADQVALCAGAWSKPLAENAGVALPLQAVEHMYIVTEPLENVPEPFPVLRDLDSGIYLKGDSGRKIIIGGFEPNAKCWDAFGQNGHVPFLELAEDWQQFEPFMQAALNLLPALEQTGVQRFMNGPESFTADTRPLIGQAPNVDSLFLAAGMNSVGIMSSAGIGRSLADWMIDGHPSMDLWEVDIARVDPLTASADHMQARMRESVADLFAMHWPYKQQTAGRNLRQSVLHDRWKKQGAVFGVTGGLERGLWFAKNDDERSLPYSVGTQTWQAVAEREAAALRGGTVLLDLTAFSKFDISGHDALPFLQTLAAASIDVAAGRCVYTTVLNDRGGIEADVTITRTATDRFKLTSGGQTRWRDLAWLRRAASGFNTLIEDVSEHEVVLGVMGDTARETLQQLSADNWIDFPFASARQVTVAGVNCMATRLSYIGEPGWELTVCNRDAQTIFDALIESGVVPMGQHALNSCRIEKRFLHWGHDIGPDITPFEAGLDRTIDWSKNFTGKAALMRLHDAVTPRRLCLLQVEDQPMLLHDELVYCEGEVAGATTSGTRGVRCNQSLAIALMDTAAGESLATLAGRDYEIDVAGQRYPAKVLSHLPHDPDNEYMRR